MQLFRPKPAFEVDIPSLEASYKALQFRLHPDRFATRPSEEQKYAASQSALVSHAYKTLRSPLKRAEYLVRTSLLIFVSSGKPCISFIVERKDIGLCQLIVECP